jgi:hypothetical protein
MIDYEKILVLEQEQQKNVNASISTVILENCLVDEQDKTAALFTECQKYAVQNHSAKYVGFTVDGGS